MEHNDKHWHRHVLWGFQAGSEAHLAPRKSEGKDAAAESPDSLPSGHPLLPYETVVLLRVVKEQLEKEKEKNNLKNATTFPYCFKGKHCLVLANKYKQKSG